MQKQTSSFVVVTKGNVVTAIGRSTILQPKVDYRGNGIKWYEDKLKSENGKER